MEKKKNYYVEWWSIKKSSVISVLVILLIIGLIIGGVWWGARNDWFSNNQENTVAPKDSARIISFEGDVRITRASTRETDKVAKDTYLMAGDTIQTQADGKAQIKMIDGSILTVRPNSTVVIRDSASIFGGTSVRVALDDGQINVKTQDQNEASNNIVEVKQVESKLQSQTDASFNSGANGGEIRISRGGVESTVGGEKITIKDGEFASISQNGKISAKERLYESPKLIAPPSLEQILANSDGKTDITFRWQKPDGLTDFNYSIELAASPFFVSEGMIIQRSSLTAPSFTMAGIAPGVYYWRVRGTAASGQTSEWSEPYRFSIIKREGNETLAASDWQVENIGGKVYIISGKTMAGAVVRILGRETFAASDGLFRLQVSVPGSEVTAEINDEHGNRNSYVLALPSGKVVKQF